MSTALSHFRHELATMNSANAPALFACATLTAVYLFRITALELKKMQSPIPVQKTADPPSNIVDRGIHSIMQTFRALRGARSILLPDKKWVARSSLSAVCMRGWWPKQRVPADQRAADEDRRLAELEQLWMRPGRKKEKHFIHLSSALKALRMTYALVSMLMGGPGRDGSAGRVGDVEGVYGFDCTTVGMLRDRAAVFTWGTHLTTEFVELVERKNMEALVITAHYAVLIGRVREVWWMDGLGAAMIRTIAMALGRENLGLIAWPASVLGVNVGERVGLDEVDEMGCCP